MKSEDRYRLVLTQDNHDFLVSLVVGLKIYVDATREGGELEQQVAQQIIFNLHDEMPKGLIEVI